MKRSKKKEVTWVVMGPAPHFATCVRCGEHVDPPKLPMRIEAFVKYGLFANELHRYCEEKVGETAQGSLPLSS